MDSQTLTAIISAAGGLAVATAGAIIRARSRNEPGWMRSFGAHAPALSGGLAQHRCNLPMAEIGADLGGAFGLSTRISEAGTTARPILEQPTRAREVSISPGIRKNATRTCRD